MSLCLSVSVSLSLSLSTLLILSSVEDTLYDWTAASGKCDLAGSEESLREECSDGVPSDGRAYWVGVSGELYCKGLSLIGFKCRGLCSTPYLNNISIVFL